MGLREILLPGPHFEKAIGFAMNMVTYELTASRASCDHTKSAFDPPVVVSLDRCDPTVSVNECTRLIPLGVLFWGRYGRALSYPR